LFLEKGPLRTKAQAIAAKCGIKSVSEDVERCLSMVFKSAALTYVLVLTLWIEISFLV
jgi:hypothetical protein